MCHCYPMNVTQDTHNKVVEIVNNTLEKAKKLWPSRAHLMVALSIDWEVKQIATSGLAYCGRNRISFNSSYINEDGFWSNTIVHEVAHHIQHWIYPYAKQAHGPEFRRIMMLMGGSTHTHHAMKTPDFVISRPNEYECPICKKSFNLSNIIHKRIQAGQKRWCASTRCNQIAKSSKIDCSVRLKTKEVKVEELVGKNLVDALTIS